MAKGKLIIFSAPSGSGKSTIINYLMTRAEHALLNLGNKPRAARHRAERR